ncbi:hypothetical protein D3C79_36590 [compost metagenome]
MDTISKNPSIPETRLANRNFYLIVGASLLWGCLVELTLCIFLSRLSLPSSATVSPFFSPLLAIILFIPIACAIFLKEVYHSPIMGRIANLTLMAGAICTSLFFVVQQFGPHSTLVLPMVIISKAMIGGIILLLLYRFPSAIKWTTNAAMIMIGILTTLCFLHQKSIIPLPPLTGLVMLFFMIYYLASSIAHIWNNKSAGGLTPVYAIERAKNFYCGQTLAAVFVFALIGIFNYLISLA